MTSGIIIISILHVGDKEPQNKYNLYIIHIFFIFFF